MALTTRFAPYALRLLVLSALASNSLARQPEVQVQFLGACNVSTQSTPPAPAIPTSFGTSPQGFDMYPGGRMTMTLSAGSQPRTTFVLDGSTATPIFPAGEQALGIDPGFTYQGGLAFSDANTHWDPAGNCHLKVPLSGFPITVSYWGPLDNPQALAPATRIGPTAHGWWLKQVGSEVSVGMSPDPTTIRIAAGQKPIGVPVNATNLEFNTSYPVSLFDSGEVTAVVTASLPGQGLRNYACIADATSYRVLYQLSEFIPDLGYYHSYSQTVTLSCSAGGDASVLCTGGLSLTHGGPGKGAIWKTDALGHSTLLLMEGQQVPTLPAGVVFAPTLQISSGNNHAMIDANGSVVAWLNLAGPGVTASNNCALLLIDGQGPHLLLRSGDTIRFGARNVTIPPFCGEDAFGPLLTSVFMNRRGDIALHCPRVDSKSFLATYHKRTGWVGLAAARNPPVAGFPPAPNVSQVSMFTLLSGTLPYSSGYDMGFQRLDDDGWVYHNLIVTGQFMTRARVVLPSCPADFDADGTVDFFDYDAFVACFEGGPCPPGSTADFDGDGSVDFFDYDAFVTAFESPCD